MSAELDAAVRDAYRARWGPPARSAAFQVGGLSAEVLKWPERTSEGVALYAAIGASAYAAPGRPPGHRSEFYVGLLPERDEIASPLAALALYGRREGVALGDGDTVPSDGPLWPGTTMAALLITRPRREIMPALVLDGGLHVEFLQVTPIHPSERRFKAARGADALWAHWEQSAVEFWNRDRPESVPG